VIPVGSWEPTVIRFTGLLEVNMPNSVSAKKRLRQSQDRRLRNRSTKSALRSQIRKVRTAVQAGDVETASKEFVVTTKRLDQAAAKKVIHANQASRLKSRLSASIKKIKAAK
jgi:small subunit ribosomal protein S20